MVITVLVTNYNYGNYLGRCIRSLIDQSLPRDKYEIIVVDDASTDHSQEVMQSFAGYIRPVFNEVNLGLAETCNKGLKLSVGRFVVRVDADDYVHHDFLLVSQLYMTMNYQQCDAVAVDYVEVDEEENVVARKDQLEHPIACGITFKMDALTKIGLYKSGLRINEEVELMQRFQQAGLRIRRLDLPLYRYKKHSESLTATFGRKTP
jgi:glycosyltransferase involved in cell wall biosynthesis